MWNSLCFAFPKTDFYCVYSWFWRHVDSEDVSNHYWRCLCRIHMLDDGNIWRSYFDANSWSWSEFSYYGKSGSPSTFGRFTTCACWSYYWTDDTLGGKIKAPILPYTYLNRILKNNSLLFFLKETLLRFLRVTVPKTPVVRSLMPAFAFQPERRGIQATLPPMSDPISYSRDFCGALFFPTVATFLGATLYKNVPSQFKRTLLGGLTFAVVKGLLKIYHKQHQYIRTCQKQILDHQE